MADLHSDARMLIAVRVVVVTSLLLAALLIQFTVSGVLPINYLYLTTATTYAMTLGYIALGKMVSSRRVNLSIQFAGDLIIVTMLVYFTGGLDSPFSFLYLVSIITAAMLLYRRGGLIAASGAVIMYGALTDLMYYGFLPYPTQNFFPPSVWTAGRLYMNLATNIAGFYATALLTSYISEKLRKTFQELDVNRQNLAELQALNQNVVQSIPSGLITLTPFGTVSFINPAGCQILDVTPQGLSGRNLVEAGIFSEQEWSELRNGLRSANVVRGEKDDFLRNGERRSLGYALTPLNTIHGSSYGFTLVFQDLTEMKQLEAQLRLKDRMAAVGELSAGIAHEIRNPLAAISGSVQVLKGSDRLTSQEQRLMSIILKESDRLNKSIADFLRFVKPQEKKALEFDIAASLNETLELLSNSAELKEGHRIESRIQPSSFNLVGDADQIRQVFWNIAKNAIQAMPAGGVLSVATEVWPGEYRILFSDTGRGFSDAEQRRLFQPFRTNFPTGTGLGMAISYRIIQEHGGRIAVDSAANAGTTITVTLPVAAKIAGKAVEAAMVDG